MDQIASTIHRVIEDFRRSICLQVCDLQPVRNRSPIAARCIEIETEETSFGDLALKSFLLIQDVGVTSPEFMGTIFMEMSAPGPDTGRRSAF
jgi:hypothetical protein